MRRRLPDVHRERLYVRTGGGLEMTEQTPDPERLREEQTTAAGASRRVGPQPARGVPPVDGPAAPGGSLRPATDLAAASEQLLSVGARSLDSAALREALLDLHDFWLTTKAAEIGVTATSGFAIVATGGLGRGELAPFSDLDLTLLHDNMPHDIVCRIADSLWYPLWDANIRIDHSVRTVPEALKVAGEDISAGLAMLEARHIVGDSDLSSLLSAEPVGSGAPESPRVSMNSSGTPKRGGGAAARSRIAPSPT